jgi:hypothetical protein
MTILTIVISVAVFAAVFGWFSDRSKEIKENKFNRDLRTQLDEKLRVFEEHVTRRESELTEREELAKNLRQQFDVGFLKGRRWLAHFVSEADRALDESIANRLRSKGHPAIKAAQEVSDARSERRLYKERAKFLEFQILSLKEYFPFLEEYEDVILDEAVPLAGGLENIDELQKADPVLIFVSKAEYESLTPAERNQRALDRFLSRNLSNAAIGKLYEQYIGYLYESQGWQVEYHGIFKGFEDLGRDLICKKRNDVKIIQAKCWSSEKLIHEKHIFQLFGTTQLYLIGQENVGLFTPQVSALFVTTTDLSPVARIAAEHLHIEVMERKVLNKKFPIIKCNINQATGEKIYHLPFDQQYDRTKIVTPGEQYVATTAEAENLGFRRAHRHMATFA